MNPLHVSQSIRSSPEDESRPVGSDLSWGWPQHHPHRWRPPTDAYEIDDAFVIVVEIAGMRGIEFAVSFDRQVLWIRGTRADTQGLRAYHQMEIAYGEFETGIQLRGAVDEAGIEANYSDGFLRVVLPKVSPKRIEIAESP
jgi:HSP20 family molecular chaperone IbpA